MLGFYAFLRVPWATSGTSAAMVRKDSERHVCGVAVLPGADAPARVCLPAPFWNVWLSVAKALLPIILPRSPPAFMLCCNHSSAPVVCREPDKRILEEERLTSDVVGLM